MPVYNVVKTAVSRYYCCNFLRYGRFSLVRSFVTRFNKKKNVWSVAVRCASNTQKLFIWISRRIQMVFRFYFKAFRSVCVCIYPLVYGLFSHCNRAHKRCFALFVIVLFWFSRTNIPNVFWNVVFALSAVWSCMLAAMKNIRLYSSLHDSAFYFDCIFERKFTEHLL